MLQQIQTLKVAKIKEKTKKHNQKKEGFYLNMANYLISRHDSTPNTNFIGGSFK